MSHVRKLILGHGVSAASHRPALKNQVYTVLRIWRNYSHHDYGIERIIRLFLATIQFLSLGLYIKHIVGFSGSTYRKIAIEVYVLLKMIFPLIAIKFGWTDNYWVVYLIVYFLAETIVYVTSLIFISDAARESVQPRRSLALLFINFFEIIFDFAFMYSFFDHNLVHFFTRELRGGIDAIYFSFVTAATVGYGDIAPLDPFAEKLVICQITLTFIFVGLFLNYFANLLQQVHQVNTHVVYKKTRHTEPKGK